MKFRAWDINTKEMLYEHIALLPDGRVMDKEFQGYWQVNPALIPMLSTGIKDKNGVEVYRGDNIKRWHPGVGYWMYGTITWDELEARFRYVADFKDGGAMASGLGHYLNKEAVDKDIEVIGNIYENPEHKCTK